MVKIPAWMRQHTVTYHQRTGTDAWNKPTYAAPVTITGVRMEPTSKIVLGKDNVQQQLASILYYDCAGSQPQGLTFHELDTIDFGGRTYTAVNVDTLYAFGTVPHHTEVGLI